MGYTPRKLGNPDLDREMLAIAEAIRRLEAQARPSVIVADVSLTTADRAVYHKLGQPIAGVRVIKQSVAGNVLQVLPSPSPESWVYLRATTSMIVTLEFV